jgi:hypothetical protein
MLPHPLRGALASLEQPRLFAPIPDRLLDAGGILGPDTLRCLDRLLCEEAARAVADWPMPIGLLTTDDRDDRWRLVSSLQKAVRRGDVAAAMAAAHACHHIDDPYLWRRLVVIAMEDVLLGNLHAVALTLALAGNRRARTGIGGARLAAWIAGQLAGGLKDRSACNLCVLVDLDRDLVRLMPQWAARSDSSLAFEATYLDQPIARRMMAAWLLAGTKRFWNINVPTYNDRPRWTVMRLMIESRMPLVLYYIADRAAVRGGGCLFVSLLPLWLELRHVQDDDISVWHDPPPPSPLLGAISAASYDMHTREGRAALRRFGTVPEIARVLDRIAAPKQRFDALCETLFIVEGGRLDRRRGSATLDACNDEAVPLPLRYFGLADPDEQSALIRAVADNLPTLNGYRAAALTAARPNDPLGQIGFNGTSAPTAGLLPNTPTQLALKL